MSKFEVMQILWSDKQDERVKVVIGKFDKYTNARIFAEAYSAHYSATTEIVEYKRWVSL